MLQWPIKRALSHEPLLFSAFHDNYIFFFRRQLGSCHSYRLTVQYYAVKHCWHNLFVCPRTDVSCSVKLVVALKCVNLIFLSISSLLFFSRFFFNDCESQCLVMLVLYSLFYWSCKKRKHIYVAQYYCSLFFLSIFCIHYFHRPKCQLLCSWTEECYT